MSEDVGAVKTQEEIAAEMDRIRRELDTPPPPDVVEWKHQSGKHLRGSDLRAALQKRDGYIRNGQHYKIDIFPYLQGSYLKMRISEVFGAENWGKRILHKEEVFREQVQKVNWKTKKPEEYDDGTPIMNWVVVYTAVVRVNIRFPDGTRWSSDGGSSQTAQVGFLPASIDQAMKGAVTGATKKAVEQLGQTFRAMRDDEYDFSEYLSEGTHDQPSPRGGGASDTPKKAPSGGAPLDFNIGIMLTRLKNEYGITKDDAVSYMRVTGMIGEEDEINAIDAKALQGIGKRFEDFVAAIQEAKEGA